MKRFAILTILFTLLTANAFAQDKQFLYIEFSPADATLEIDGEVQETILGVYEELLPLGEYTYKLYKEGYTTKVGTLKMSDKYNTHRESLWLNESIGYISILSAHDLSEASIYIDQTLISEFPRYDGFIKLSSGQHQVQITHPLFKDYTTIFELADEDWMEIIPELERSHVIVTLDSGIEADIFVNDKLKGNCSCIDTLLIGETYKLESRIPGLDSTPVMHTVSINDDAKTIILPDPTPFYGSLKVTSTPSNANVFVDGKRIGQTPYKVDQILIGEHTISVKYKNYESSQKVNISKGELKEVFFDCPYGSLSLTSSRVYTAQIYIDGTYRGNTPKYIPEMFPGEYEVSFLTHDDEWIETYLINIEDDKLSELSVEFGKLKIDVITYSQRPMNVKNIKEGQYPIYADKVVIDDIVVYESTPVVWECGNAPISRYDDAIRAGEHIITLYDDYDRKISKTIDVIPESITHITFDLIKPITEIRYLKPGSDEEVIVTESLELPPPPPPPPPPLEITEISFSDQIDIVEDDIEVEDIIIGSEDDVEYVEYEEYEEEAIPFQLVEEKPSFLGGDANQFAKWVNQRLVYPEIAKENGVQGRVTLQFTVEKDGRITNVKVLRGVDPSLDKEAVRVVSSSPKWTPGKQRNRAVPVTYTFPVIFQLR